MPNAKVVQENSTMEQSIQRTQHHVSKHLVIGHLDVANSDPQAKNFFELELDGGTNFGDFVVEVFTVGDRSRELAG
jgi:hypothetical protein